MPARVKTLHEALALSGLIAIVLHGLLLLGDSYLRPGLAGIALPFALASQPVWTGLGIIAGWLAAIVTLSFYVRRLSASPSGAGSPLDVAVYLLGSPTRSARAADARSAWLLADARWTAVPIVFAGVPGLATAARRDRGRSLDKLPPRSRTRVRA